MDKKAAKYVAGRIAGYVSGSVDPRSAARDIGNAADPEPAVLEWERARAAADEALIRHYARATEGLIGAELQRREAERWVDVLCKLLTFVREHRREVEYGAELRTYYTKPLTAPPAIEDVLIEGAALVRREADRANLAAGRGVDGTTPRVPVPEGWTYLGRDDLFDIAIDGAERIRCLTEAVAPSDTDAWTRADAVRLHWSTTVDLYDRHREARRGA